MGITRQSKHAPRYEVKERLAAGGMGTVYRAIDRANGVHCAMKRINPGAANDRFALAAFKREYQVLASLDHPRIIRVFDYGVDEFGPYYTMELLSGRDMRKAAPLPYREACRYLVDIATSLALLHARRVIHRDLSPDNVRITDDEHCKLLDFGALVAFGCHDKIVGTPPLVPPEALHGLSLDHRADLYSLGALAYWMLTGRHAYPARELAALPELWEVPLPRVSTFAPEVPEALDALVTSLLNSDPQARPGSCGEVIALLQVIGELPREPTEVDRLAMSFLLSPRFTGRTRELELVEEMTRAATQGQGGAICIEALPGMGRTRMLEEISVRARLAGATVLSADATVQRQSHGTASALARQLFEKLPDVARAEALPLRHALSALGLEPLTHPSTSPVAEVPKPDPDAAPLGPEDWFVAIAKRQALAVLVDNIDEADDRSLGLLAALATLSAQAPLLVVTTRQLEKTGPVPIGIEAVRSRSKCIEIEGLSGPEMLELTRSLFGDPPSAERFSEWLRSQTAGSPLYALEIVRQLVNNQLIRYTGGIWTLPVNRPESVLPAAFADALSARIASLDDAARALAECLSLQHERATFELCKLVTGHRDDRAVLAILDELARNDVLHAEGGSFRFSSTALRDTFLREMTELSRQRNHQRLGLAFAELAGDTDPLLRIEAGWHLLQGEDELRGADMIASVTYDAVTVRTLIGDLHHIGRPLEAALQAYNKHRRSVYERMPILAALAMASFYEDRAWAERYGYAALDVLEDLSGLRTARSLRRFFGKQLGLVFGLVWAFIRFQLAPKSERKYSFTIVLVQLMSVVSSLTSAAALAFDNERAARIADMLEPFAWLPERLTAVGFYEFCRTLQEIGRDNQAHVFDTMDKLIKRFGDPRYYPALPADARKLYIAAAHFTRGAFATFRADASAALESADALDKTGIKLYAMVASQLRFLYHTLRGELGLAAPHRAQVELHAAHVGSAWQVEIWEAAVLLLVNLQVGDVVGSRRAAHRLETQGRSVPSLKKYARLSAMAYVHVVKARAESLVAAIEAELLSHEPRAYNGWSAAMGYLASYHLECGHYAEAKRTCERALARMTEADREYVAQFLVVELTYARVLAALGDAEAALATVDRLLLRFKDCNHPLALGQLHEARARIAWHMGDPSLYAWSLTEMERWFLPTGTPALISRCKNIAALRTAVVHPDSHPPPGATSSSSVTVVESARVPVKSQILSTPPRARD